MTDSIPAAGIYKTPLNKGLQKVFRKGSARCGFSLRLGLDQ